MAKEDFGALSTTMEQQSKLPLYGATDEQLQALKDAQQKALGALEQRYAQPNWFKVAAGFAKPQLGGFLASLGSASEAMGENVEQQRAQELPIAQMRSQLAQTNYLMGQNKTVSDMMAERKAKNLPITPEFVREVTARFPESSIAKALAAELGTQQKQQEITASMQRNALTALEEARRSGLQISPEMYKQAGLTSPDFPGGEPVQVAPPQNIPSSETAPDVAGRLPSGARVNQNQMYLANLGIPIISGMRTQEEQDALKHHQGPDGTWYTEKGLPVADVSKHTSGKAIDVDSSKMTDEHRGMLKALGYKQTDPKNDPNHWEMTGYQAPAKSGQRIVISSGETSFSPLYTQQQVSETRNASDQELNKIANTRYASLESVANPKSFSETQHALDSMIKTIVNNPQLTQEVVNPLAKQGGILGGVLNAAEAGMGFSVSGLAGNIHLPASRAIIGSYTPEQQAHWQMLNQQASRIGQLQQQLNGVNPSSIRSGEIEMYNRASVDPGTQGANVMLYNLQYTKLNNEMLHEMYQRANAILQNRDPQYVLNPNSRRQMMDIMTSPAMSEIEARYRKRFEKLNDQFSKNLGG